MPKTAKKENWELLDVNDLITRGKTGILAYSVTGNSELPNIRPNDIVFADPNRKPKTGDVVIFRIAGRNCVRVYEENRRKGPYLVAGNKPQIQPKSGGAETLGVAVGYVGFC